jgi:hypothetical protein
MARTPDPKSKAGFVRAQPTTMTAAAIVSKAKASGIKLDERYVYSVRTSMNKVGRKAARSAASAHRASPHVTGGLEAAIEALVERKVNALLKERLGTLFGR